MSDSITDHITRPNFFIVGAPKCGTTSLYAYLRQHPAVFMPDRKEPHFFSVDIRRPNRISEEEYFGLFHGGAGRPRIGEASADYFYSEAACRRIKEIVPDARIIIILRNPVDKIYSAHAYRLWLGREDVEDFEEALERDFNSEQTGPLSKGVQRNYLESGKYAPYVRMYLDTFGIRQVHVIIFEEMLHDPHGTFIDLCRFLEIGSDVEIDFGRYNAAKRARLRRLTFLFVPGSKSVRTGRYLPKVMQGVLGKFARRMRKWNTRFEERPAMGRELRGRLEREFEKDVAEVGGLLGRDLSGYWFPSSIGR